MMFRLIAQAVLATSVLQFFPHDAAIVERYATLPEAEERMQPGVFDALDVMERPLPSARDAERAPVKVQKASIGVVTSAVSALVVDRETGTVLFEKNGEEPRSIGSITKLMAALVFLEGNPDLEAPAAIEAGDIRYGGIQHVSAGDEVTVGDLLLASLVPSDNSATAALVRLSGLSRGDFVARMNEKAARIGMRKTTFVDATGLSAENRSVVSDIALLLDEAMENDLVRASARLPEVEFSGASGRVYRMENTNELLGSFLNADPYTVVGGKTGFLPEAGYCLGSIIADEDGHELAVIVLGSRTKAGRFQDVKALSAWAYKTFDWPDQLATEKL